MGPATFIEARQIGQQAGASFRALSFRFRSAEYSEFGIGRGALSAPKVVGAAFIRAKPESDFPSQEAG